MPKLHVVKPFRFSSPGRSERDFPAGVYDLESDDPVFASDWIKAGADGCVRTPEDAKQHLRDQLAHHKNVAKQNLAMAEHYQAQLDALEPPKVVGSDGGASAPVSTEPVTVAVSKSEAEDKSDKGKGKAKESK